MEGYIEKESTPQVPVEEPITEATSASDTMAPRLSPKRGKNHHWSKLRIIS